MTTPDPTTDDDTKAGVAASDANLAGIVEGRRRAARALLSPDRAPADQVRTDFAPLTRKGRP